MKDNNESFAMEILKDYKKQNKRLFIIVGILLGIITLFVGGLVYIFTNYDFSYEDTEVSTYTGNACIGDDCGNGDINGIR